MAMKVFLSIAATFVIVFGSFFLLAIVYLGGTGIFYANFIIAGAVILWTLLQVFIWNLLRVRTRLIVFGVAVALLATAVAGYEIDRAYHNSIEKIDEQGVDLSLYEPFREDTLAVSLLEPSALTLSENLPSLDGATALYPIYAAFARAVYDAEAVAAEALNDPVAQGIDRGTQVLIPEMMKRSEALVACSNTSGAYRRLIDGEVDIIFVAGPSTGQRAMAEAKNVEMSYTPIGREAFVFFVNAQNPVVSLSISDIQRILLFVFRN